jgi:hypothetical protein
MTTNRASCGFRFPAEVILWAVRWYLQSPHQLSRPQPYGGRGFRLSHLVPKWDSRSVLVPYPR